MTLRLHKTGIEFPDGSWQKTAGNGLPYRNLLINSDMRIDQRNNGGAVTVNANKAFYPVDRFSAIGVDNGGVFTAQQVSDSIDGGDKSLKFTVTTPVSSGAYRFHYNIEGNHIAHLGFGQSWAKTFTLSFWVKSSVTGTYSGSFRNSAHDRSYVFEYTIDVADTWEKKTITVTADTTGTWLTDNGSGLKIVWNLGSSNVAETSGSWQSGNYFASTNQTQWIATSGATFYISQIQLEVGETATPFEVLPYDVQLNRCMRYYEAQNSYGNCFAIGSANGNYYGRDMVYFNTTKRTAPTITLDNMSVRRGDNYNLITPTIAASNVSEKSFMIQTSKSTESVYQLFVFGEWEANAEL